MIHLAKIPASPPADINKGEIKHKTDSLLKQMAALQNVLFAEKKHAILIVLQGTDASGKDSTVSHVFTGINPMGCKVESFKQPSNEELAHDFLWRIHRHCPERGMIQIFNRSHYEDILVPAAHGTLPDKVLEKRMDAINHFEAHLQQEGTVILKFHLHISREEQTKRLNERMNTADKNWKYQAGDRLEAKLWNKYMETYNQIIHKCSKEIPWEVVPADHKWYRNHIITKTIVKTLENLKMDYPKGIDNT